MAFTLETEHARTTANRIGRGLQTVQMKLVELTGALADLDVALEAKQTKPETVAFYAKRVQLAEAELDATIRVVAANW